MQLARAHPKLLIVAALSVLTICLPWLTFRRVLTRNCSETQELHGLLIHQLQNLHDPSHSSVDTVPLSPKHNLLRTISTYLLNDGSCLSTLSRHTRQLLEFSLYAKTQTDGVLLYLFSILGTRSRVAVELHSETDAKICATLAVHHGWRVVTLVETWTGYDTARKWYEQVAGHALSRWSEAGVQVLDAGRVVRTGLVEKTRAVGVSGVVDLLVLFADGGDDITIMSRLNETMMPRVLVMRYQDYWGSQTRATRNLSASSAFLTRRASFRGKLHDYNGASLISLIDIAERTGYRLIWCLSSEAIAIFVHNETNSWNRLASVAAPECIKMRNFGVRWRKDMEAMWDEAQNYDWDSFK